MEAWSAGHIHDHSVQVQCISSQRGAQAGWCPAPAESLRLCRTLVSWGWPHGALPNSASHAAKRCSLLGAPPRRGDDGCGLVVTTAEHLSLAPDDINQSVVVTRSSAVVRLLVALVDWCPPLSHIPQQRRRKMEERRPALFVFFVSILLAKYDGGP